MRSAACLTIAAAVSLWAQTPEIRLTRVAGGLRSPVDIQSARDGTGRLFVAEQPGVVRVIRAGQLLATPMLDIRDRISSGGERGLLGIAFPPGFHAKQYFYVSYTDLQGHSVIARYRVFPDRPDEADPTSEERILFQRQPFANHNGGQIIFGPDGYLYIGLGDGGSGGDPQRNGQNGRTWLGKLLRIDVESATRPYTAPPDNPFVNNPAFLPEIWAYGLRNPWRFSFDRETRDLWIADVGQNRAEEVNFTPASSRGGENYGWNLMEGLECFIPNCDRNGLALPVHEYTRGQGDVSVTGGFVYRGAMWPALHGTYIYADYNSGRIWGLRRESERFVNRFLIQSGFPITTFGEDETGELYVADHRNGVIHRIDGTGPPPPPRLVITSAVNAASQVEGLTPGSAATVYARGLMDAPGVASAGAIPLPRVLGGVRVMVNGVEAPLFAVARGGTTEQVNFQTPFETAGERASVVVVRDGQSSAPLEAVVRAVQPGIFTSNGTDAIVVHNADHSLVTEARPLVRGEYAYLYVTGLGAVENAPATGAAAPRSPLARARVMPAVTIDGVACEVQFAGLAPDFVALYQVNFRVAEGVGSGTRNVVVSAGGVTSAPARVVVQ